MDAKHHVFMQRALALAKQAEGQTSPNPPVGAVVVKDGRIVGEGYHRRAGAPHAEVEALRDAGEQARGATLYVTLEPCNHHGRTPPCTQAIIGAGISEVFYAIEDPNPHVNGQGGQRLKEAGIQVHSGLFSAEAQKLIRFFSHFVRTGLPYVVVAFPALWQASAGMPVAQVQRMFGHETHQRRQWLWEVVDAVFVGAEHAFLGSDPLPLAKEWTKMQPRALLSELAQRQLTSVLLEGDLEFIDAFLAAGLVNEVWAFLPQPPSSSHWAAWLSAGAKIAVLSATSALNEVTFERLGSMFLMRGLIN